MKVKRCFAGEVGFMTVITVYVLGGNVWGREMSGYWQNMAN